MLDHWEAATCLKLKTHFNLFPLEKHSITITSAYTSTETHLFCSRSFLETTSLKGLTPITDNHILRYHIETQNIGILQCPWLYVYIYVNGGSDFTHYLIIIFRSISSVGILISFPPSKSLAQSVKYFNSIEVIFEFQ